VDNQEQGAGHLVQKLCGDVSTLKQLTIAGGKQEKNDPESNIDTGKK
jgi:hypothetical protein